ncbi:MAG: hypothetical protein WCS70_06845 [Verrucomicrobiota bacterium]
MDSEILETKNGYTVRIEQDQDAQSPSEYQYEGAFLVAWHSDFYVRPPGDKSRRTDPQGDIDQFKKTHHIFLIEAYIHSGVRIAFASEGNFCDRRWDVSNPVGFIALAKDEWKTRSKKAEKYARALIETWNQYLSGDVWGYVVEKDGEHVDSCWGFFGREYAETEARAALNSAFEAAREEIEASKGPDLPGLVTAARAIGKLEIVHIEN